jgi:hypothetical protein
MIYLGACHCEAIGFAYETALAPAAWTMRACGCRFCRVHAAATTSDPAGSLALRCRDPAALIRYRFGLATADFWLCRACGAYLGAATADGGFGLINTHALVDAALGLPATTARSYDGETAAARLARRHARWTPIRPAPAT